MSARERGQAVYVVGLTGGIASGKSTVGRLLASWGAVVIDTDRIAREVVEPGRAAWQQIKDTFGPDSISPEGRINRQALANLVFNDSAARSRLEAITHPAILDEVQLRLEKAAEEGYNIVVLDVPLLFEAGWAGMADEVWVVWLDRATQLSRLIARDSLSLREAEARIAAQMDIGDKAARADVVIDNGGSQERTAAQAAAAWERALERARNAGGLFAGGET